MKISVVIPAYNEGKYIELCLKSIHAQSHAPFEVIVVDNNSTDNTADIARHSQAQVLKEKKQGMIYARNAGFSAARGDIIARTDADSIVPIDWIERITKHFQNPSVVGVSGPVTLNKKIWGISADIFFSPTPSKLIFRHDILFGPNLAIRKSAWEKIKDTVCLDDYSVHEDLDLTIHLAALGKIIFDKHLIVRSSARRVENNLSSLFVDYPIRWVKTIVRHL